MRTGTRISASGNYPKTFGLFRFLKTQVEKQRSQKFDTAMYYLSNKCAELLHHQIVLLMDCRLFVDFSPFVTFSYFFYSTVLSSYELVQVQKKRT